jgi:hypothetical protein
VYATKPRADGPIVGQSLVVRLLRRLDQVHKYIWILSDADLVERKQPAYLWMRTCRRYFNWLGTKRGNVKATYETIRHAFLRHGSLGEGFTITEDSRACAQVVLMTDKAATVCSSCSVPPRVLIERPQVVTRLALLRRAIQTHTSLLRDAAIGRRIDQQLLRLRFVVRPKASERAALFDDPLFDRSQRWKLSTSVHRVGGIIPRNGVRCPPLRGITEAKMRSLSILIWRAMVRRQL